MASHRRSRDEATALADVSQTGLTTENAAGTSVCGAPPRRQSERQAPSAQRRESHAAASEKHHPGTANGPPQPRQDEALRSPVSAIEALSMSHPLWQIPNCTREPASTTFMLLALVAVVTVLLVVAFYIYFSQFGAKGLEGNHT